MGFSPLIPTISSINNMDYKEFDKFIRYGFAYVKIQGHGVEEALEKLSDEALRFFRGPSEKKYQPGVVFDPRTIVGYIDRRGESPDNRLLLEQVFFRPEQPLSIFSECEKDIAIIRNAFWDAIGEPILLNIFYTILKKANFRTKKIHNLFNEAIKDIFSTLALLYYPATNCPEKYDAGLNAHTDQGLITVLWINQESLQVWIEEAKEWHDLEPKKGFVIVNIGNALKIILGELCTSAFHRVIIPKRERLSIGAFYDPARSYKMRDVIQNKLLFGGSTAEYLKDHFSKTSSYTFESIID